MSFRSGNSFNHRDWNWRIGASSAPVPPGTFTLYYGLTEVPAPPETVGGIAEDEHDEFTARLIVGTPETFEGFALFESLDGIQMTSYGNTCAGYWDVLIPGANGFVNDETGAGRFNTTIGGAQYGDLESQFPESIYIFDFIYPGFGSGAISAFGCYITDLGDFLTSLEIRINLTGGGSATFGPYYGALTEGSLMFWGFVDTVNTYDSIEFILTEDGGTPNDRIGIDDVFFAVAAQISP